MERTIPVMPLTALAAIAGTSITAGAGSLTVAEVRAPDIHCVFKASCTVGATNSIADIVFPGARAKGRLQSRTFSGSAGAPAAGRTGYQYRIDLTEAVAPAARPLCVSALKLDFGPIARIDYNQDGAPDDVFVITAGAPGRISIAAAEQTGSIVTFSFSRPICAGLAPGRGETSYFFGLAAAKPPRAVTAQVEVPPRSTIHVRARAPRR
jgi:hypothetical protein